MDSSENEVFRALADPTRRQLIALLGEGSQAVSELTRHFDMSQPAVSQHLKVLKQARLVTERRAGRNRIYELDQEPLRLAALWLADHTDFWATGLDRLGAHLRKKYGQDPDV